MAKETLFKSGSKPVNLDLNTYEAVKKHAEKRKLFVSQMVDQILIDWLQKQEEQEEKEND